MANPVENVNDVSNFVRVKGITEIVEVTLSASVAIAEGWIVYPNPGAAGQYTKADTTAWNNFGVIRQTIAATDADYASTKVVKIEVPRGNNVEWLFTVGSGTFTAADEGKYADLLTEVTIAVDVQTKKQVFITKYISATRWKLIFAWNTGAGLALPVTS